MIGLARWQVGFSKYDDSLYFVKEPVDVLCLIKLPYKMVINRYKDVLAEDIKHGFGITEISVDYIKEETEDYCTFIRQYFNEYKNLDEKSKFKWNPKNIYTIYINITLGVIGKWKTELNVTFFIHPFYVNIRTNPFNPLKRKLKDVNIKEVTFEYASENEVINLRCFGTMGDLANFKSIKLFLEYILDRSINAELKIVDREIKNKEMKIETIKSEILFLKKRAEKLNKVFKSAKNDIENLHVSKKIYW